MSRRRNLPLDGVVVVDLGQVYQGPYATYLMATAGATVIKIEPLGGEPIRLRQAVSRGSAAPFAILNGHKQCMTLNLKSPKGVEILKKLVRTADVLLENYSPGVMDKLGIGWSVVNEINPRLIYASGSGYGLSGPDRDSLAMDVNVQAVSGMMSVTGFPDGPPVKAGAAIADFLSGIHLYAGVVTALYEREFTGIGRLVEVAMQETIYPTFASNLGFMYDTGEPPPRTGNGHGGKAEAPYNVYPASDGFVAIIGIKDIHWTNLLKAIGRTDLLDNPKFSSKQARVANMEETDKVVSNWTCHRSREEICGLLRAMRVPCAPVRDLIEVSNDLHMHQRGMLEWIDHPDFGKIVIPNNPIIVHGADRLPAAASARLDQHTEEILSSRLNLSQAEISALQREGVVGKRK